MKILDVPRSGSQAGTTSSHNRAGQYTRSRRTPTNSPTARRTVIRTAMGAASSGWSALTEDQRQQWDSAADSHPVTDALGQTIKLTGHQLFVSVAVQLQNCGQALPTVPPSTFAVGSASAASGTFGLVAGLVLTTLTSGTASDFNLIAFSKPMPAGRSYCGRFSQYAHQAANSAGLTVTTAAYGAVFGSPVVGQKVFVRVTPVNQYGVTGVPRIFSMVVGA